MPIALSSSHKKMIDATGTDVVWDGFSAESEKKQFTTLNLTIPMVVAEGGGNLPKPHIVFWASKF